MFPHHPSRLLVCAELFRAPGYDRKLFILGTASSKRRVCRCRNTSWLWSERLQTDDYIGVRKGQCGKINIRETSKSARYVMYVCTNTGYTIHSQNPFYGTTTTRRDGDMRMYVRLITMLYDTGPLFTSVFVFNLTAYQTLTNESVYRN